MSLVQGEAETFRHAQAQAQAFSRCLSCLHRAEAETFRSALRERAEGRGGGAFARHLEPDQGPKVEPPGCIVGPELPNSCLHSLPTICCPVRGVPDTDRACQHTVYLHVRSPWSQQKLSRSTVIKTRRTVETETEWPGSHARQRTLRRASKDIAARNVEEAECGL